MTNFLVPKSSKNYFCEICDYDTSRKSQYDRHILTRKHKIRTNTNFLVPKSSTAYKCDCHKTFKHASSLWNHRKKCNKKEEETEILDKPTTQNMEDLFIQMIKKNEELQELLIEQSKQAYDSQKQIIDTQLQMKDYVINNVNTTNNITNNNTLNNNFNLQFFLNEQCKNAMNISEFLNTIDVEIEDVANVGKLGYVEGISRIFMKALQDLDIYERPIHCSDLKREVMYVKDNGIWEKEGEDKLSMKKAVQIISHRNVMKIKAWTDANPSWKTHYSKEEDEYLKISYESMGGSNAEEDEKYFNKIIRKLASNVTIDKNKSIKNSNQP